MNTSKDSKSIKNGFSDELHSLVLVIFITSLIIVFIANNIYYSTGVEFNTENFLMLLPFNLMGLSLTLYAVMIILYNIAKQIQ